MNQIHVLDQKTIDQIAAGEVVERPASVVKELVENAIDAGATRISVEIRDGGIRLIRVTDNGRGIAEEDIPLAFLRHATSKITDASDLTSLFTLGFRGEALSSIAAVSRVELITKTADALSAVRYLIEGGREKLKEEVGAPDGTTFVVRDLFYNTPARARFLKTPLTEASHVGAIVEQLTLANPQIAFSFLVNGQRKLASSGNGSLRDAIFGIYGRSLVDELAELDSEEDGIGIRGYIGKPSVSRGNRNYENYYVNGRYVKSRIVAKAIEDGYMNKLMNHQYPFTCLMIQVDTKAVDVNVHPTKMDVRFSDENRIYQAVRRAVRSTLDRTEMLLRVRENGQEKPAVPPSSVRPAEAFEEKAVRREAEKKVRREAESGTPMPAPSGPDAGYERKLRQHLVSDQESAYPGAGIIRDETNPVGKASDGDGRFVQQTFAPSFLSKEAKPLRRIVGQVFRTYWICEFSDSLYLFDQHAAHERVLFERLMKQYEQRAIASQQLSPPLIVTCDAQESRLLEIYGEAFASLGFEIEPFGGRDYAIRAVPYTLGGIDSAGLFRQFLDQLEVTPSVSDMPAYVRRVATEACKAAVKGGETLSASEASALLDELMACEDPYHCPHGRPTILTFTKEDLEKRFKRIL